MARVEKKLYREFFKNFKVPSREVLDANLRTLGRWMDGDFRVDSSQDEIEMKERIAARIQEQA
jgi:hypothetical protein